MVRAINADAEVSFDRDALGHVLTETCNGRAVTCAYDALGRRTHRRTPSGVESRWEYGSDEAPVALPTAGRTLRFGYDPAGREVERHLGAGAMLTQSWDANHRLASQTLTAGGLSAREARLVQRRSYGYRPDGYVTPIEDHLSGVRRFDLDPTGRVTAVHGAGWTERYAYDPAGNITDAAWPAPAQTNSPDADDRLVAVTTPDGQHWRYHYDPLGRRITKQRLRADGHTVAEQVNFTWDGAVLAEQTHTTDPDIPDRTTTWDWEPDSFRPLTQTERAPLRDAPQEWVDEQFYAIVTDLVGTPTEMLNADGDLVWHPRTTLWGVAAPSADGASCPLRFPGQYHDPETALNYNYHRYYDPGTGRYDANDPLGLAAGPNPQIYVRNPANWFDPLGLSPCKPLWTSTKTQTRAQNAYRHYSDHGADFPDAQNAKQYVEKAREFLQQPPSGTLTKVRANGDVLRYHPSSNTFGVMDKGGAPRTFFKPDPALHGHPTNLDYYNAQ
jgi:RHS repeat-associated protein